MSLFLISTAIGKALTFVLWEFTHVITYNSAIYIRDIINITFKFLLHLQLSEHLLIINNNYHQSSVDDVLIN